MAGVAAGLIGLLLLPTGGVAAPALGSTRDALQEWVKTRQMISKEKSDWQTDKETLLQTVQVLEQELQAVADKMASLSTNSTQVDQKRAQAEALQASSVEALEAAEVFAAAFQRDLTNLITRLPEPLQDIVADLQSELPTEPDSKVMAAARLQVLLSILIEVDKFNNAVTLFSEKRKNAQGQEVSVESVYVGLGAAYFVDELGQFAGVGKPGPNGWEWTARPELAHAVRDAILIYRQERSARFVPLPIEIQ